MTDDYKKKYEKDKNVFVKVKTICFADTEITLYFLMTKNLRYKGNYGGVILIPYVLINGSYIELKSKEMLHFSNFEEAMNYINTFDI